MDTQAGATVYVCGWIQRMAQRVLVDILDSVDDKCPRVIPLPPSGEIGRSHVGQTNAKVSDGPDICFEPH